MTDTRQVFFLCRDSSSSRFIAHKLWERGLLSIVIIEEDAISRKKKVRRLFKSRPIIAWPIVCLDLLALAIYGRCMELFLRRNFAPIDRFPPVEILRVPDINGDEASQKIDERQPSALVVLGTSILGKRILSKPVRGLLNIHGGIVPEYRNVHSEFWAVYNRDYQRIGTTIMHVDSGVDTGAIALRRTVEVTDTDDIFSIKEKNIRLAGDLIVESLSLLFSESLPRIPQDKAGTAYKSPGIFHLLKLAMRLRLR